MSVEIAGSNVARTAAPAGCGPRRPLQHAPGRRRPAAPPVGSLDTVELTVTRGGALRCYVFNHV
jgi:hypothetical protein